MTDALLEVEKTLAQKRILFTGATGFVGKVSLSMLLYHYGEALDKVYVLVRKSLSVSAEQRFFDEVATSEPFSPLRQKYGEDGLQSFLRQKCEVVEGDISDPFMGLSENWLAPDHPRVDVVMNCAGLVSFNPSLEVSLNVNTYGVQNVVDTCLKWNVPLVHMSTAFVAGNRSGLVFENENIVGYFPKKDDLPSSDFSLEHELADNAKLVARLRESADDKTQLSIFRQKAVQRLEAEGRDLQDERTLRLAIARERKLWINNELIRAGMERAAHWGWPNTYTYSKALGEQVIAQTEGLSYAIVRPSIVESALRFPFPGWNEGFTTSAPLALSGIQRPGDLPAGEKTILDIIPVDLVAGAFIGITAQTIQTKTRRVYHLASGDFNPFWASRSVELVGLYRRRHYRNKESGNSVWNSLLSRVEPQPVSKARFDATSAPVVSKGAQLLKTFLQDVTPSWGAPSVQALVHRATAQLDSLQQEADSLTGLVDLFLPFLWKNQYVFRCDHTREVYAHMAKEDAARIPFDPEKIDWRTYFLDVHLPGLEKWVFPGLKEENSRRHVLSAYRDLLELFEASVHAFRHRVAFRMVEKDSEKRFTYGDVHRYAKRVAAFLQKTGVLANDRILLVSENRPEWGICYFGILLAGATVVPVDPTLSEQEVTNIARRCNAKVCLLSEESAQKLPGLFDAFSKAHVATTLFSLAQAMAPGETLSNPPSPSRAVDANSVASLIFTSGTTGVPKGVMLTHRNFTSLVSKLAGSFDIGVGDGLLSVLPLHHTFEFSAGFLMPFSQGAEITYIDELTADRLGEVLETGRVTSMVGVPALWQLLHRKMTQEFASKPAWVEMGIKALMSAHGELRNRSALNLGKLLFWPVHRKFGGNLKFLVSGGSALPDDVQKAFHELGFNLSEGYGLTEAAPVLTVTGSSNARQAATVGKALPGIELRIHEPDVDGVGEVLAKGPNVMAGYFDDPHSTEAILKDGWLHTGDLGKLDSDGRLFLVGRKKDVIIDANGKNVYPDELENLYGQHPHIKELSVVGMPDPQGGETIACLCVPDYKDRPRSEVRKELEEHFRNVSSQLAFFRRIKTLKLWEGTLPRTSTRKIKRPDIIKEIQRLERVAAHAEKAKQQNLTTGSSFDWLAALLAEVLQKPVSNIHPHSQLVADLGFDSLLLTELGSALEQTGVSVAALGDLTALHTVHDLQQLLAAQQVSHATPKLPRSRKAASENEIPIPEFLAQFGRSLLSLGQKALYETLLDMEVTGQQFIPQNRNFLVVANHTSHLDMGLVKHALGAQGRKLTALAARDYFFNTPLKRAYFENFTQLIPMDRSGSLRESLRLATEALNQGFNLLIFPEGTRSPNGEMQEFKPTLGYLALTAQVDVLPLYIRGAYDVLPKGSLFPKGTELSVHIGPLLSLDLFRPHIAGMARSESYRWVTEVSEEAVRCLKDGRAFEAPSTSVSKTGSPHRQRHSGGER